MSLYYEYSISLTPMNEHSEILIAFLGEMGFESFTEENGTLKAYMAEKNYFEGLTKLVDELKPPDAEQWNVACVLLPDTNWNEEWEKNYAPVEIGKFCRIRAAFHPTKEGFEMELTIDPKMAFGTGHHATTSLMVETLFALRPISGNIADVGCGTSVLAIVAEKLGASHIDAVDIEEASVENSLVNINLNNCSKINVSLGSVEHLPLKKYNMIIANINRNVLASHLPAYAKLLEVNGKLLLSGFFVHDNSLLINMANALGFQLILQKDSDNWSCLTFEKNGHA